MYWKYDSSKLPGWYQAPAAKQPKNTGVLKSISTIIVNIILTINYIMGYQLYQLYFHNGVLKLLGYQFYYVGFWNDGDPERPKRLMPMNIFGGVVKLYPHGGTMTILT